MSVKEMQYGERENKQRVNKNGNTRRKKKENYKCTANRVQGRAKKLNVNINEKLFLCLVN
jgi:hypothetical protein